MTDNHGNKIGTMKPNTKYLMVKDIYFPSVGVDLKKGETYTTDNEGLLTSSKIKGINFSYIQEVSTTIPAEETEK